MNIQCIAVLGVGTMGHGIAQVAAQAGYRVWLQDTVSDSLIAAQSRIAENLAKGVARGKLTTDDRESTLSRINVTSELEVAVSESDLVIEAIVEDLSVKQALFRKLEEVTPPYTTLASNTSSLSISEIAQALKAPSRLVGMHFFNPAHIMKLLEIVITPATSEATLTAARDVGTRMNKESITVKDSPGFATSRLGVCVGLEAIRMVEEGVASPEDIDKALVLGYNHPMGPLRLGDLVGLDIRLGVASYLHGKLGERFRPPELLKQMVGEGKLGQKTGQGFYTWER